MNRIFYSQAANFQNCMKWDSGRPAARRINPSETVDLQKEAAGNTCRLRFIKMLFSAERERCAVTQMQDSFRS
jgi:hypothetical protein